MPTRPAAVLFDLGGVLMQLDTPSTLGAWFGGGDERAMWTRWLKSAWPRTFDRGACSLDAFVAGCLEEFELTITPEAFLKAFRAWPVGPWPGAFELLAELEGQVVRACLSNTNALHITDQESAFGWRARFEHSFFSHELGLVKPDAGAFDAVVRALDLAPEQILFLDDNEPNVVGARASGMQAARVDGVVEARATLRRYDLLGSG